MTDKEIKKALECCEIAYDQDCTECPLYPDDGEIACREVLREEALDLITRQQAENENLKVKLQSMRGAANSLKMHYEEAQAEIESLKIFREYAKKRANDYKTMRDKYLNAKSEAVKEFAEKLKEKSEIVHLFSVHTGDHYMVDIDDIDNIAKEMVGENNG